jgi:hypothetical protein
MFCSRQILLLFILIHTSLCCFIFRSIVSCTLLSQLLLFLRLLISLHRQHRLHHRLNDHYFRIYSTVFLPKYVLDLIISSIYQSNAIITYRHQYIYADCLSFTIRFVRTNAKSCMDLMSGTVHRMCLRR